MVVWSETWLEKSDSNQIKIRLWAQKKNDVYATCKLCNCDLKFSTQGFQCLYQHSQKPKHQVISNLRFGKSVARLRPLKNGNAASNTQPMVILDPTFNDKVSAAEAMWLFKVAEDDMSFRDCDGTPELFQNMFSDSEIAKSFTMSKDKASYVLQDGLGPLLLKWLCSYVKASEGGFTLIFDETTTVQKRKQMDLLVRYWNEENNEVTTSYIGSLFFCRAKAIDVTKMLVELIDNDVYALPWSRLFNISVDGPNINKAIYRNLNESLKKRGYKGLIQLITCTLHVAHNAFRKGIISLEYGEMVEQLLYDLYAWFKSAPCKSEDFIELSESVTEQDEALFIRHINSRWLTLSTAIEKLLIRWDDCKKYFLTFVPTPPEYRSNLPKNKPGM